MGPTAAGKSALALEMAKRFGGEIVSADSRQIYRGMDIGTEKIGRRAGNVTPTRGEPIDVRGVPHYLIDILTPDQRYSAAEFRDDARRVIEQIMRRGHLPIVVGGTGFYLRVLTGDRPLANVPADPKFRAWAESQSVDALAEELHRRAPDVYAKVDNLKDRRRVTRYLEISRGRTREQKKLSLPNTPLSFLKIALLPPTELLRQRMRERVDEQFHRGFIEEVRRLVAQYGERAPGLQAVGYRQVLPFLRGTATLAETRNQIISAHWRYAHRQLTWLKREPRLVRVFSPAAAHDAVRSFLETEKGAAYVV